MYTYFTKKGQFFYLFARKGSKLKYLLCICPFITAYLFF